MKNNFNFISITILAMLLQYGTSGQNSSMYADSVAKEIGLSKYRNSSEVSQYACALGLYCEVKNINAESRFNTEKGIDTSLITLVARENADIPVYPLVRIAKQSKQVDVFVMNEAHDNPLTRLVAAKLLYSLRNNGYKTIFMEALSCGKNEDKSVTTMGLYFRDPVMVYLYRQAIDLGYKVLCYDTSLANDQLRDSLQAERILAQADKHGKIIILSGYDHASQSTKSTEQYRMLNVLKRRSGYKILNIDTYKFSFTGAPVERALNKVLSSAIDKGAWFGVIGGNSLGPLGLDTSAYNYFVVYKDISCNLLRSLVLSERADIRRKSVLCKANSIVSVISYERINGKSKESYLVDRIYVHDRGRVKLGIPHKHAYKIIEKPVNSF